MNLPLLGDGMTATLLLVGLLGFRHGFDADHIAAVDGMTRARQLHHSYWTARLVGLQFAAGHSATILVAALVFFSHRFAVPAWLDGLGLVISMGFLLLIAAVNLGHALRPARDSTRPTGVLSGLLLRLTGHHLHPALVGMAFALSFDSMAQAAYFATQGDALRDVPGFGAVALLAGVFGLGMMVADATNGALLSWFAARSDALAQRASRFSSAFIACIALATAAAGMARQAQGDFAALWERAGVGLGVGLMGLTLAVYALRILHQRMSPGPRARA